MPLTPDDAAVIESARETERPEALVLLTSSAAALRIAAAWGSSGVVTVRAGASTKAIPADPQAAFAALWRRTTVHVHVLMRTSNTTEREVRRHLPMLKANQLVYPDGTVHALVRRLLRERVLKEFRTSSPVRAARPPQA